MVSGLYPTRSDNNREIVSRMKQKPASGITCWFDLTRNLLSPLLQSSVFLIHHPPSPLFSVVPSPLFFSKNAFFLKFLPVLTAARHTLHPMLFPLQMLNQVRAVCGSAAEVLIDHLWSSFSSLVPFQFPLTCSSTGTLVLVLLDIPSM